MLWAIQLNKQFISFSGFCIFKAHSFNVGMGSQKSWLTMKYILKIIRIILNLTSFKIFCVIFLSFIKIKFLEIPTLMCIKLMKIWEDI